jgi:hypothetical protein
VASDRRRLRVLASAVPVVVADDAFVLPDH